MQNILRLAVVFGLCGWGGSYAPAQEATPPPASVSVKDACVMFTEEGVLACTPDFSGAEFKALPEPAVKKKAQASWGFALKDYGWFIFRRDKEQLWCCHYGESGWTAAGAKDVAADDLAFKDGKFTATGTAQAGETVTMAQWEGEIQKDFSITWKKLDKPAETEEAVEPEPEAPAEQGDIDDPKKDDKKEGEGEEGDEDEGDDEQVPADDVYKFRGKLYALSAYEGEPAKFLMQTFQRKKALAAGDIVFPEGINTPQFVRVWDDAAPWKMLFLCKKDAADETDPETHALLYSENNGKDWKFIFEKELGGRDLILIATDDRKQPVLRMVELVGK